MVRSLTPANPHRLGSGAGEKAAVAVFGEEGRQAAEVAQAVLPWACLAPDVTLQRLLRDWALHRRQVPHASSPSFIHYLGVWQRVLHDASLD